MEILIRICHGLVALVVFYFMTEIRKRSEEGSVYKSRWVVALLATVVAASCLLAIFPLSKPLILFKSLSLTALFLWAILFHLNVIFKGKHVGGRPDDRGEVLNNSQGFHVGGRPDDRG